MRREREGTTRSSGQPPAVHGHDGTRDIAARRRGEKQRGGREVLRPAPAPGGNAIENLAVMLTAAGCNYFMGLPMGDDSMLSYQSTSFHDAPTLRQLFKLRPAPEFEKWMVDLGLMKDGVLTEKAGDPSFFLKR